MTDFSGPDAFFRETPLIPHPAFPSPAGAPAPRPVPTSPPAPKPSQRPPQPIPPAPQPAPAPPPPPPPASAVAAPAPSPVSPSSIPEEALTFVEVEEDGSPAYYTKVESHWDWPGGISGPTIGVGYDMGYVTKIEAIADWTGIVDDGTLAKILQGVGLQGSMQPGAFRPPFLPDEITIAPGPSDRRVQNPRSSEVATSMQCCTAKLQCAARFVPGRNIFSSLQPRRRWIRR